MDKKINIALRLILLTTVLCIFLAEPSWAGITLTATDNGASIPNNGIPVGDSITLTATVTSGTVDQVSFYSNGNLLGVVTGASGNNTFTYVYNAPPQGTYTFTASEGSGVALGGTINGQIDMVGDSTTSGLLYANNPAADPLFADPNSKEPFNTWLPVDNQMCSSTWPYNGASSIYQDGTCEWSDSNGTNKVTLKCNDGSQCALKCPDGTQCSGTDGNATCDSGTCQALCNDLSPCSLSSNNTSCSGTCTNGVCSTGGACSYKTTTSEVPCSDGGPCTNGACKDGTACSEHGVDSNSTVDSVDETMHTLSDFVTWADSFLSTDLGSLNVTFDTWYKQAAAWIAPQCGQAYCSSGDVQDDTCVVSDYTCNLSSSGRLLNIYGQPGYPNIPSVSNYSGPKTDVLGGWNNQVITPWLGNSYTPPSSTSQIVTSSSSGTSGTQAVWCVPTESSLLNGQASTAEDTYINANSGTTTWGDLPHVIACENYNAGPLAVYQTCLNALTSGASCTTSMPQECSASSLGNPSTYPNSFQGNGTTDCNVNVPGSFANWVSSNVNFGPAYNYDQCVDFLSTKCPSSLTGTPCDPKILGRTLLNPAIEPEPAFTGGTSCDANTPGSFAQWAKDSSTLFSYESSKFALRSAFLSDVYKRAHTMQNVFTTADNALQSFLSPCLANFTCKDGSVCSKAGRCSNGALCGACGAGGPAAQLIWARHNESTKTASLPNSVIYGWQDAVPIGGSGGCVDANNNRVGCAHIVKVTAYAPGRNGNPTMSSGDDASSFVKDLLPWVNYTTSIQIYYMWTQQTICTALFGQLCPVPVPWNNWTLEARDGYVYISVKRWDQEHANPVVFPNGHAVWQSIFHNPSQTPPQSPTSQLPAVCLSNYSVGGGSAVAQIPGLSTPATSTSSSSPPGFGYGLQRGTVLGLGLAMTQQGMQDTATTTALSQAFMLNDEGDGSVDTTNLSATSYCSPSSTGSGAGTGNNGYCSCLAQVNALLNSGTESHMCAEYVASRDASKPSTAQEKEPGSCWSPINGLDPLPVPPSILGLPTLPTGLNFIGGDPECFVGLDGSSHPDEADYSIKFVNCNSIPGFPKTPPSDMNGGS